MEKGIRVKREKQTKKKRRGKEWQGGDGVVCGFGFLFRLVSLALCQTGFLSLLQVLADEDLGGLPELDAVDHLLGSADGERDRSQDLRPGEAWHLGDDERKKPASLPASGDKEEQRPWVKSEGLLVKVHEV